MFGKPSFAVLALKFGGCASGGRFEFVRHELGEIGLGGLG